MPYSLKLLLIGLLSIPIGVAVIALGLFDRTGKLVYHLGFFWTWAILKIGGIRLKIRGLEQLDADRSYIFIANHQSYIDIPIMIQALPGFQLRWIAKKELLRVPLFGWAMWSSKHIIVDRFNLGEATASMKKAEKRIKQGVSVVIFPEGTRSAHGELLPFKRGGFVLAVKTRVPIVPVIIAGSSDILAKGDWRIKKGEVHVTVSKPVPAEQYRAGSSRALMDRVRAEIEAHQANNPSQSAKSPRTRAQAMTRLPEKLLSATVLEGGATWIH